MGEGGRGEVCVGGGGGEGGVKCVLCEGGRCGSMVVVGGQRSVALQVPCDSSETTSGWAGVRAICYPNHPR